jgi:primosomal protein N' (replication factor Y)
VGPGARRGGPGRGEEGAGTQIRTCLTVPDEVRLARETLALPPKQAEVLAILCRRTCPLTVADVCRLARCATGPIAALRQRGLVHTVKRRLSKAGPMAPGPRRTPRTSGRRWP